MLKIKFSSKSKRPVIKHNHLKYYGFEISKLPNRFCSVESEQPIRHWFNYKGFTFIQEQEFINLFGKITIE